MGETRGVEGMEGCVCGEGGGGGGGAYSISWPTATLLFNAVNLDFRISVKNPSARGNTSGNFMTVMA